MAAEGLGVVAKLASGKFNFHFSPASFLCGYFRLNLKIVRYGGKLNTLLNKISIRHDSMFSFVDVESSMMIPIGLYCF